MRTRFIFFVILPMMLLLASGSWAADGENIFKYSYGHADGDPNANNLCRGACAGSDLDQDGLYEIIITDYDSSGMVHVYEVVGNDSIEWVWSSAGSQGTVNNRQVHTGDMDNDGVGEIIFIPGDGTWSATYEGGIHVYEWDGVTDNGYGIAPASIYKPNPANQNPFRAEDFDIGDVDQDGENELMIVDNTTVNANDGFFILSVDGDFQGVHTWVEEAVFLRSGPNVFGGSPINAQMANMDGDNYFEAVFQYWDSCAVFIVEATGPDAYAFQAQLTGIDYTGDGVNLDNFVVADLNSDGADELYLNIYGGGEMAVVTGGADVSTITRAANVTYIAGTGETGAYGMGLGDQDHGPGSDGMDLYIAAYGNGLVYDHELTGIDPTLAASWTKYTLWEDLSGNSNGAYGIAVPPVDMDGDGRLEVVVTYLEAIAPPGKWFRVFEFSRWWVSVEMSSFTATGAQEMVELSWRVESETDNAGFNIYRDGRKIAFVQSQGTSDAPRTYTWIDREVKVGVTYTYKIGDVSLDGIETVHDFEATATPKAAGGVPTSYSLSQNYPNPFNADTHIEFSLAQPGLTTLRIYNTTGQLVRTLVDGHLDARVHKVRWDGRNEHGEVVSSGVYFYRLASGTFAETRKMSFLR